MAGQVPPSLKAIQPYLKIAVDYDKRDPVVAYYCRMFAVKKGIKLDSKGTDSKSSLFSLMDQLEKSKTQLGDEEAMKNDIVAQAYIEDKAMKLFIWADTEDRAARFGKNVVKGFYTSSLLFEVLTLFGELNEETAKHQKYAKWKAAYIIKCQKAGQTPIPGPQEGSEEGEYGDEPGSHAPAPTDGEVNKPTEPPYPPSFQNVMPQIPPQPSTSYQPPPASQPPAEKPSPSPAEVISPATSDKVQKYCRYAIAALQYDDVKTSIDNLEKALELLRTCK